MLVLTRRKNEVITIDGTITVKIAGIKGGRVSLAIEAPPEVSIRRVETLSEIQPEEPPEAVAA
jgi:carbon storage regulator CsrA